MTDTNGDGEAGKVPVRCRLMNLNSMGSSLMQAVTLTSPVSLICATMTNPVGQEHYILKPRGVRLVDNSAVGHLKGTVAEGALLFNEACTVAPEDGRSPLLTFTFMRAAT